MDYTKLFDLYVKKEPDTMSAWMTKPFLNSADGNVWATDGHAAVIVAMDVAGLQYDKLEKKLAMPCELPTDPTPGNQGGNGDNGGGNDGMS